MAKITKVSEHIEQACRVYGEHWRDILFKKWSFFHNIDPNDSHVFLVLKPAPSVSKTRIYDTEEEATRELLKVQNERLNKIMARNDWTLAQYDTRWVRGLENDLEVVE